MKPVIVKINKENNQAFYLLPRQDVPKYDKEFVILWLFVVFLGAMSIVTPEPSKGGKE